MAAARPSSPAAIAAVATARCNGELTSRVDGRNLEEIRPAEAEAVTVEVFARWVHDSLSPTVLAAGGETLAVRVWETAVAFGGYRARLAG